MPTSQLLPTRSRLDRRSKLTVSARMRQGWLRGWRQLKGLSPPRRSAVSGGERARYTAHATDPVWSQASAIRRSQALSHGSLARRGLGMQTRAKSRSPLRPEDEYYSHCYCISSWFRLPEQGMDDYELLSRASCFLVERPGRGAGQEPGNIHIVTSAHVVHPFAFPNYYPPTQHAWLRFVAEQHVMTKFEIRARSDGAVMFSVALHERVFRHDTRDICVLHPTDPPGFLQALSAVVAGGDGGARPSLPHLLTLEDDAAARENTPVMFVGHQIIEDSGPLQEQLPSVVPGRVLGCTPHGQAFAATESTLQMGMCGGPVLNASGKCVGATEGIVPETGPEPLRNCAAIITAGTVRTLLDDVDRLMADEFPPR